MRTEKKTKPGTVPRTPGPAIQIRDAVSRIIEDLPSTEPFAAARSARRQLKRKEVKHIA